MAGLLGRLFRRRRTPELRCSAVVPAAGSSTRMEGQDKLLLPLEEQPVLLHTLRALELCPYLAEIIVVTREDLIVPIGQLCRDA
ncbi:MAG: NTP transferase domain-containing protein [Flavonifractor plautii]